MVPLLLLHSERYNYRDLLRTKCFLHLAKPPHQPPQQAERYRARMRNLAAIERQAKLARRMAAVHELDSLGPGDVGALKVGAGP